MVGQPNNAIDRRRQARSLIGMAALTWAMFGAAPVPTGGRWVALVGLVAVADIAWIAMALRPRAPWVWLASMVVCGSAGVALTVFGKPAFAVLYPTVACLFAGWVFGLAVSAALTATLVVAQVTVEVAAGTSVEGAVLSITPLLVGLLVGVVRRQQGQQAEQRELLRAETEHAREERARAAALAERARLAREIHDVLAHTLSALSVQLETAGALLEHDRGRQAAEFVDRASRIAREGLAETRRAVTALRGDPLPLPELVTTLAEAHRGDLDTPVEVRVTGTPRPLSPETGHALYRSVQEALANVRKHAPGAGVAIDLAYRPEEVRLTVTDDGGGISRPSGSGLPPGYGLTGLRERAELAGGTVDAGPTGTGWRVDVRIPG